MVLNPRARKMLDTNWIDLFSKDELLKVLNSMKDRNLIEARALLIALYFTGARPSEVLELKSNQVIKEAGFVHIKLDTKKHGQPRQLVFNYKDDLIKELYLYTSKIMPDVLLFYHFRNRYTRVRGVKTYIEITGKLGYYFKKWFKNVDNPVNPYFLRHSRMSQLSQSGATPEELRWWKGAKKYESVTPYLHQSEETAKKISKKVK
jgi:site-specific recombinase XerD